MSTIYRYVSGSWIDGFTQQATPLSSINASFGSTQNQLTVSLDARASVPTGGQTLTGYSWDFGDNTALGSGVTTTHTYASPGTYSVTLTVQDSSGASSSTNRALIVKSTAIEYIQDATPIFSQTLQPAGIAVAQCIIQSPDTAEWYMSQVHPEATALFGNTDSMRISRMRADGTLLDQMLCNYGGHGTSIGLEYSGGQMYIWATYFQPASGTSRTHDIVRFPYTPGTYDRSQIPGLQVKVPGGIYRRFQFDWKNGYVLVTEDPTWKRYKLTDFLAGSLTTPVNSITVPVNPPTIQGLATYGDSAFLYAGDGADTVAQSLANPGGPFTMYEYSWKTGTQIGKFDLSTLMADDNGTYTDGHIEPESTTIFDRNGLNPVLNFGMISGPPGGTHTYYVWSFDLISQTDALAGRSFELRATKPTPGNVGAGILRPLSAVHNGDMTITTNGLVLKDTTVNGAVTIAAANVVIENCVIKGPATDPGTTTVNPIFLVNTDNAALANGPALIRYSTITSTLRGPNVYGVGSRNYTLEFCDIAKVVEGARASTPATTTPTAAVPAGTTSIAGYSGVQLDNAVSIMRAAIAENFGSLLTHAQEIGVMTAMGESGLRVLSGTTYIGLFQQSSSWGTTAQRMDPYQSAILFYNRLKTVSGWETMTPTHAAHAVQINADPEYYTPFYAPAQQVVAKLATTSTVGNDASVMVRGNYIHDLIFFCPDPTNPTNVGALNVAGDPLTGTWAGKNWNWSSGVHLLNTSSAGIQIYGNNINANWSADPTVSSTPLPPAYARLNAIRMSSATDVLVEDNWLDSGEQCFYAPGATTTGDVRRNRFGRGMATTGADDSGYYALVVASPNLLTYDTDTVDDNVWADTGDTVNRRAK
jgi:PKD repeat protein